MSEGANNAPGKNNTSFFLFSSPGMEGEEDVEREQSENEIEGDGEGDNQAKQEYVKKEYFARPYNAPQTEAEVRSLTTKNSR